jgi:hypothetical protein
MARAIRQGTFIASRVKTATAAKIVSLAPEVL